jgi:flavin-dependent dehydrogenase
MKAIEYDIAIIGGGPAGSAAGLYLSSAGFNTCLIERKKFPREVLCGEFLSGEVSLLLKELNLFEKFLSLNPVKISRFNGLENNQHLTLIFQPCFKRSCSTNYY